MSDEAWIMIYGAGGTAILGIIGLFLNKYLDKRKHVLEMKKYDKDERAMWVYLLNKTKRFLENKRETELQELAEELTEFRRRANVLGNSISNELEAIIAVVIVIRQNNYWAKSKRRRPTPERRKEYSENIKKGLSDLNTLVTTALTNFDAKTL